MFTFLPCIDMFKSLNRLEILAQYLRITMKCLSSKRLARGIVDAEEI